MLHSFCDVFHNKTLCAVLHSVICTIYASKLNYQHRLTNITTKAVPWLRRLAAGLSPRRPGFDPLPIPVAVRSKAWVCGLSLTGIVGSNPTGGMDVCVVFVV